MRWLILFVLLFVLSGCTLKTISYHGDVTYGKGSQITGVEGGHWSIRLGTSWKFNVDLEEE